jgi:hypothetical protein
MLNSHPELAVPHETRFLVDAFRRRRRWGDLSDPQRRRELARWVISQERSRWKRLVSDAGALEEAMVAAAPTLGSVLASGFALYADRHGKTRWGDKRPSYVTNLDAVFALFPDAQFVNVVRDPRSVVSSVRKIGWFKDGLVQGTEWWERSERAGRRWDQRLAADQFHEVCYERLVTEPRSELSRLVAFLGLGPAGLGSMLNYHEQADISSTRMHPLVRKPLTTSALRTFETALEPHEIAFIEQVLAAQMKRRGYEPVAPGVPVRRDLLKSMRRRRALARRNTARRWLAERRRNLSYRQPLAAVPSSVPTGA